ncbi:MAG: glycosyltransferase [Candidatus Gracilibacteria bacterium]|nr:glycosyltransferase [Candidatus Gracilibacteria bacterium]
MGKKTILIILYTLHRSRGTEKIATILGNNFIEIGYNVKYLTFYNSTDKFDFIGEEFCLNQRKSKNLFIEIINFFKISYKIAKYCRENNIDISFSHGEEANFHNIISKIFFRNPSKIFIQIHSAVNALNKIQKYFIKKLYNYTDRIITIVKEEESNLINNYNISSSKIKTIYNPVDIKNIESLKNEDLGEYYELFENKKFTFINIARLSPEKNQEFLLNSFEIFNKKYKNSQLIILGDGPLKENLNKQRETLESKENIHFLGNHKNPYKFLDKADCFVLTSNTEGLPGVILESLALGIPIISTDCKTGPKEILRKTINNFGEISDLSLEEYGILIPLNNENLCFEAMEKIYLDKSLRENYKIKGLERSKYFQFDKIMKNWKEIL